jgi:uncharacterized protein YbgA (DUF1722 family)/uncharacterized protein YbbK (DUF523 family)
MMKAPGQIPDARYPIPPRWAADRPIRIGVSACLLGQQVRFDGGHKRDYFLADVLSPFVEWVPVCPEVEVGMGVPRESIRLVRRGGEVRLIAEKSGVDHTDAMRTWSARRLRQLEKLELCGYVLKKSSPSCGMERVRVYGSSGMPTRAGRGVFADALLRHFEHLPVEEEGRLNDAALRESFIERVFAYRRLHGLFSGRWTRRNLIEFHSAHKLQLMAHSPAHYRELGRLVGECKEVSPAELRRVYQDKFMQGLERPATTRRHVNVLQHISGYFRDRLDDASRRELHQLIADYAAGLVPLVVPLTLVRHHVRHFGIDYLAQQLYLDPHPKELMLRNHV